MHIVILHNQDHEHLEDDPGREAREDVVRVAASLADALSSGGTYAQLLPVTDHRMEFLNTLSRKRPDLVINLCESVAGNSGGEIAIPCLLDVIGVPYTGASALSLALTLHKDKAKEVLRARGVSTPDFVRVDRLEDVAAVALPFPLIVKPVHEDASVGVDDSSVVHDAAGLRRAVERVLTLHHQPALVEQFIAGREIYVPLLGNTPRRNLPLAEIRFGAYFKDRPKIVSYRAKWVSDSPECIDSPSVPGALEDAALEARIVQIAMEAFSAMECRDYGRVDLRVTPEGVPYVIEVNPNCDLHPEAGFARSAYAAGMDYRTLVNRLVDISLERAHGHSPTRSKGPGAARRADSSNRNLLAG